MKITVELPEGTVCAFVNYVEVTETGMQMGSKAIDTDDLREKNNPEYESKTKRLQLLIRPSTYEALKRRADEDGDSVNNLINTILEKELL